MLFYLKRGFDIYFADACDLVLFENDSKSYSFIKALINQFSKSINTLRKNLIYFSFKTFTLFQWSFNIGGHHLL
jgi:hypothetical protein